ncbi:MAG: immunoglobulin domain-containing protein [Phycisphaerales bacterium]|nr:immunoglobulin domain-containing protein [Planctomycetota bacterium]
MKTSAVSAGLISASLLLSVAGASAAHAQCQPQWLPGDGIPGVDGHIYSSVMWDPDGAGPLAPRLVVAGGFSHAGTVAASNIAMWDGSSWAPLGSGTDGEIQTLAVAANGDLVAAGDFLSAGGIATSPRVARWNGTAWSGMGDGFNATVYALLAMPDGDVVAGGYFLVGQGVDQAYDVARWNGTTWVGLHAPVTLGIQAGTVYALALLPNGDIVAGGNFMWADNYTNANGLARWNGSSWSLFGTGVSGIVNSMAVTPSGDLVIAGVFGSVDGVTASRMARWNGSTWFGYPSNSWYIIDEVAAAPSGELVAVGYVGQYPNQKGRAALWNGAQWVNFGEGVKGENPLSGAMTAVTVLPDGKIFTGGNFRVLNGKGADSAAVWNGSSWSTLGNGISNDILAAVTLPNGDLIAAGRFLTIGNIEANYVARWNGVSWSPLGAGTDGAVNALAVLPSGDVVAGGEFTSAGGTSANRIAKWNGSTWSSLGTGMTGGTAPTVAALAVYPNGDIAAGGLFTTAGGVTAGNIARWNGSSWSAIGGGTTGPWNPPGYVCSAIVMGNGDLVIGGEFNKVNNVAAYMVARWNGTAWSKMNTGLDNPPNGLTLQADGSLIAGGPFLTVGEGASGPSFGGISRWSGTQWLRVWGLGSSNASAGFSVNAIDQLPSNGLIAGGSFTMLGGMNVNNLIRRSGASTWTALGSGTSGRYPAVYAVRALADKEIIAAGSFTLAGGVASGRFARWTDLPKPWIAVPPAADSIHAGESIEITATPATGYSGVSYQWLRNGAPISNGPGGASPGGGTVSGASGTLASPTDGTPAPLSISSAQPSDAGSYTIVFSNPCGSATSAAVAISVAAACPSDLNHDAVVDDSDFVLFAGAYDLLLCSDPAMPAGCPADLNADTFVDDADFSIFAVAYDNLLCP